MRHRLALSHCDAIHSMLVEYVWRDIPIVTISRHDEQVMHSKISCSEVRHACRPIFNIKLLNHAQFVRNGTDLRIRFRDQGKDSAELSTHATTRPSGSRRRLGMYMTVPTFHHSLQDLLWVPDRRRSLKAKHHWLVKRKNVRGCGSDTCTRTPPIFAPQKAKCGRPYSRTFIFTRLFVTSLQSCMRLKARPTEGTACRSRRRANANFDFMHEARWTPRANPGRDAC
jgi:hypothetical protein